MGGGRWTSDDYADYSRTTSYTTKSTREVFNSKLSADLDPRKIKLRESCDSTDNPNSLPIILALDVTGSMGEYAAKIAKESLPELMTQIIEQKPVADPHLMFMGVDDIKSSPTEALQVSQFEADIRILQQLREMWLVGRGGGNRSESYDLPWYFAGSRVSSDAFTKRGKKGYLFTFGDEEAPYQVVTAAELATVFGPGQYSDVKPAEALAMAKEQFHVFHICIEQGNGWDSRARDSWVKMLGTNALFLRDFRNLTELIISTIRIAEGADMNSVIAQAKNPDALRRAYATALADGQ